MLYPTWNKVSQASAARGGIAHVLPGRRSFFVVPVRWVSTVRSSRRTCCHRRMRLTCELYCGWKVRLETFQYLKSGSMIEKGACVRCRAGLKLKDDPRLRMNDSYVLLKSYGFLRMPIFWALCSRRETTCHASKLLSPHLRTASINDNSTANDLKSIPTGLPVCCVYYAAHSSSPASSPASPTSHSQHRGPIASSVCQLDRIQAAWREFTLTSTPICLGATGTMTA